MAKLFSSFELHASHNEWTCVFTSLLNSCKILGDVIRRGADSEVNRAQCQGLFALSHCALAVHRAVWPCEDITVLSREDRTHLHFPLHMVWEDSLDPGGIYIIST